MATGTQTIPGLSDTGQPALGHGFPGVAVNTSEVEYPLTTADIQKLVKEGYTKQQIIDGYQTAKALKEKETALTDQSKKATSTKDTADNMTAAEVAKALGIKPPAPKKAAANSAAGTSAIENQISASNLFNNLGQSLVGTQEKLEQPIEQAVSGALTEPAESTAAQTALNAMGLSPNSSAASWLNSEIKQANVNDQPMAQAMNAYGQAFAQGQAGIQSALGGMGAANQLEVQTAPEADWVQALTQHILSNVNYYGEISPAVAANIPTALQQALGQSGGGGEAAAGSFPITDTASQWASAIQNYYKGQAAPSGLPGTAKASTGASGDGTGGVIPSDVGTAPS